MDDKRLSEIEALLEVVHDAYAYDPEGEAFRLIAQDVPALVAEVRRLRAVLERAAASDYAEGGGPEQSRVAAWAQEALDHRPAPPLPK